MQKLLKRAFLLVFNVSFFGEKLLNQPGIKFFLKASPPEKEMTSLHLGVFIHLLRISERKIKIISVNLIKKLDGS